MKIIKIEGKNVYIVLSTRKNKKYDVYNWDNKYLFSFGDNRYMHYKDK
jgi:hypothetical protein